MILPSVARYVLLFPDMLRSTKNTPGASWVRSSPKVIVLKLYLQCTKGPPGGPFVLSRHKAHCVLVLSPLFFLIYKPISMSCLFHKCIGSHLIQISLILLRDLGRHQVADRAGRQNAVLQRTIDRFAAERTFFNRLHAQANQR